MIMANNQPIGFFDSGVGGISVLKKAMELLPHEDFIYFGDSVNAPYGDKDLETIKELSFQAVDFLLSFQCKSIVVACNTATSAAISDIRAKYPDLPVIGIEPALKVAIDHTTDGKILVLATNRTLHEEKFRKLSDQFSQSRNIVSLPLPGLVEIIENGEDFQEKSYDYLRKALKDVDRDLSSVVLGCTHYPFIKPSLRRIFSEEILIVDGSEGTARRLKEVLTEEDLLHEEDHEGTLRVFNSSDSTKLIDLTYRLLKEDSDKDIL